MTSGRMTMAGTLWRCVACRFHHWLRAAALLSGLAFSSALLADSPGESRDCRLAPGDRITVSVVCQAELSGDMLPDGAGIQNEIEFLNAQTATTNKQLEIAKQHARLALPGRFGQATWSTRLSNANGSASEIGWFGFPLAAEAAT